jgi:hypothetical protein
MSDPDTPGRIVYRGAPFHRGVLLLALAAASIGCQETGTEEIRTVSAPATTGAGELRLDYGPILRAVDSRSAHFLFHAARTDGSEVPWTAGVEISRSGHLDPGALLSTPVIEVGEATDFVAHLTVDGLAPQTRYTYVPLIDGRRALDDGPEGFPSFLTPPELGGRNADFTVAFLADQHTLHRAETTPLVVYDAAAQARPLFWAQLGDVAAGNLTPESYEEERSRQEVKAIWKRNYGDRTSPQARFAGSYALNLATISDHELMNNFNMNWHRSIFGGDERATLHDRVDRYDLSIATWWNYFGWGSPLTDRLGRTALGDHGESVMAEPPTAMLEDLTGRDACVADEAAGGLRSGSFVYLVDDATAPFHARVAGVGSGGSCGNGQGTVVTLSNKPDGTLRRDRNARLGVGARYARHGHYHSYQPFPFVEFFVLDTTSYRGDPYQESELYARDANRDTDHSRYPWDPGEGRLFIYGDREHGANRTTDGIRSWLGPAQKAAFLDAIGRSPAEVLVVAAGYPLHSAKFEWSERYWEARECGFDFATELEEILAAIEGLDKLVLWVHGDGHTPMLVRLRPNLYQLQIGATFLGHTENPGHRSRTLTSGERSASDSVGGGELIAGHQPDLSFGDDSEDFFAGHLDKFEGYLRLYFHPGREALRSSERSGLRRGDTDRVVEIPVETDPARGAAGRNIVGKVVRLHFGERRLHSVVESYRFDSDHVRLEIQDPIVTEDPDRARLIIDGIPWVEAKWFDARGREWREFSAILRKTPGTER